MIDAKELRIGNWINRKFKSGACRFSEYVPTKFVPDHILLIDYRDTDAEGILLTPQLLEKCGFKTDTPTAYWKKEKYGTVTFKLKNFGSYHFFLPSGRISFRPAGNPTMLLRYEPIYLHQLQNLYYALTGEELEVHL